MEERVKDLDEKMKRRWWTNETVAVVTGANRGIGLQIVRQMASNGLSVVLTSRDKQRGLTAITRIDNHSSTKASITSSSTPWMFRVLTPLLRPCIDINYYGAKRTTKALTPLLRPSPARPRIVNVSSLYGLLQMMPNETLRNQLSDVSSIDEEFIDSVLNRFLEDVKTSTTNLKEKGWPIPFSGNKMSKIALNAYTRLLASGLEGKAYVNCIHPGYVKTDITFHTGDLSAAEGAENVVRLALAPPGGPSGCNFLEKEIGCF